MLAELRRRSALARAPFAARAAVLVFRLDAQPPVRAEPRRSRRDLRAEVGRGLARGKQGPGPRTTEKTTEKTKGWEGEEREEEARPQDARAFSLEKAQPAARRRRRTSSSARKRSPPEPTGSRPNSARAPCVSAARHRSARVRGVNLVVSLRVTFEGRDRGPRRAHPRRRVRAARTLLRVWPPEPESGVDERAMVRPSIDANPKGSFETLPGRACEPGARPERAAGVGGDARAETRLTFKPVGESVALLFLRDPEGGAR